MSKSAVPSGLVLSTSNASQSFDEIVVCDTEDFVEYIDELAEKAVLLRNREDANRGVIIRPCDSSRYFTGGKRKAKRNIRKRFGPYYKAKGTFVTLTYNHEKYSRWEAWGRLPKDLKRFKHDVNMRCRRAGRKSPMYIAVIEEQKRTGYPHVHMFFPGLRFLLPKEDLQALWGVGRTRVEYAKGVNIGGYVCKYITKMGGWSDEALAFIWKRRIRLYSYSRCYKLPIEDKEESEWAFLVSTTRKRIEDNLSLVMQAVPEIENLAEYLEEPVVRDICQGRAKRGRRRALTNEEQDN